MSSVLIIGGGAAGMMAAIAAGYNGNEVHLFEKNDRLNLTEYTQAALVTTCLAMEKVVEECGLHPDITAGLSLGEYCAIAVSGGMSVKDAIVTVRKRGIL